MQLQLPVQTEHRAGRMLDALLGSQNRAAKLLLTVELERGETKYHQTFHVRKWARSGGDEILQIQIANSADWNAFPPRPPITVLSMNLEDMSFLRQHDRRADDPVLVYAAEAALMYAWTGQTKAPKNGSVRILEESVCGRCGLPLTDPESIDRGVGPDCYGKMTGTTTIRGRRKAARPTAGQEPLA